MIGLFSKFGELRLIRSELNTAMFRVEEVQEKERKKNIDFKAHIISRATET